MDSTVASIPLLNFNAYLAALCVAGSGYLLGRLALVGILRSRPLTFTSSSALSLGLGFAILPVVVLAVGQVPGLILTAPWALLGGAGVAWWLIEGARAFRVMRAGEENPGEPASAGFTSESGPGSPVNRVLEWVGWFLVAGALGLVLIRQLCPPLAYDALEYHVGVIPHYFEVGAITPIPNVFYSAQPIATEMLYALASFAERDAWGGGHGVVQWGLVALAAGLLALTLARIGTPRALVPFLVLLLLHHPIAIRVEMDRMTDLTGAIFMMTAWLLILETGERRGTFAYLLLGMLAAGTVSSKWTNAGTSAPAIVIPALILMFVKRSGEEDGAEGRMQNPVVLLLASALGFALIMGPWMAWVGVHTGNPIAPFGAGLFPTERWGPEHQAFLMETHGAISPFTSIYWTNLVGRLASSSVDLWPLGFAVLMGAMAVVFGGRAGTETTRRGGAETSSNSAASWAAFWLASPRNVLAISCVFSILLSWLMWGRLTDAAVRFLTPTIPMQILLAGAAAYHLFRRTKPARAGALLVLMQVVAIVLATLPFTSVRPGLWGNTRGLISFAISPLAPGELEGAVLGPTTGDLFDAANALPEGSKLLAIGEARRYPFRHPITVSTVFDNHPLRPMIAARARTVEEGRAAGRESGGHSGGVSGGGKTAGWATDQVTATLVDHGYTHVLVNEYELSRLLDFHAPPVIAGDPELEGKQWLRDGAWLVEKYPGYAEFGVQDLGPTEREIYVEWLAGLRARATFVAPEGATSPAMWIARFDDNPR